MKIPYFCCIGAELKRYQKDFDFMNQVYLYKVPTDDTIDEVFAQDYFKAIADTVLQDDIVYVYESAEKKLHICKFELSAGHITAIRLAADVISVNGKTGEVVLTAEDILAEVSEETDTIQKHLQILHDSIKDIELFKFPNATIVGEPTINHGQVSGFTTNDYLQFPTILDLHNKPFVIDFCFTTGNDVTTQQNILDSQFGLALAIANGKGLMAISHNGTSWAGSVVGTMNIQPNTTYYARLSWNRMNYQTQLSTDGTTYVADMNFGSTQSPYPRTIFIGGSSSSEIGHTPHPFGGSINLNYAYLTVDGQIVWQGMDDAGLATRMDIDAGNISDAGKARIKEIARNGNISNCITEIPQDIKLELSSDGTLTLKAGSKVYVPSGAGVFDVKNITSDKTITYSINGQRIICVNNSGLGLNACIFPAESGSTEPVSKQAGMLWYDITNNICKRWNGSSWEKHSLPIAIITISNGAISSIDQVFNGFGYIGSTVFALPGVKGLIPNGRNADGSLKNTEFTVPNVLTGNITSSGSFGLRISSNFIGANTFIYDEKTNLNYLTSVSPSNARTQANGGNVICGAAGAITSFTPKAAFHAVDYNDTEFIAQQSAPSDRYIDLTLGNDGDTYKVPADGFVFLSKKSTAAGQLVFLINDTASKIRVYSVSTASGQDIGSYIPVKKGDVVRVYYNVVGATNYFRFVYANGSK